MSSKRSDRLKTNLVHAGRDPHNNHGVVNPPVYHASTILQPSLDKFEAARSPTGVDIGTAVVERQLAAISRMA